MALDLRDVAFFGPALPEPFVKLQLEALLAKQGLLQKATGAEGKALRESWDALRRKLRALGESGGAIRVANHVLEPLAPRLGYDVIEKQDAVETREGLEDGGVLFRAADGAALRAWSVALGTDLDAPSRRGRAYRFSPSRIAGRVLLAKGERAGLLTDGHELRLLLCDPARPESHVEIALGGSGGWRRSRDVPDSYRLLLALASPAGVRALPALTEAARLAQTTVTRKLREQARRAVEGFLQEVLDHPANRVALEAEAHADRDALARTLWNESLILVYRLLFVLKLESSPDPARAFSFASTALWRQSWSPSTALAPVVRESLDRGADTGGFLEASLRALFRLFTEGMASSELRVHALGGALFGADTTPVLGPLTWGETAVANLLDALLWTSGDGAKERERVHYGALDVEDLGRVYEALLELEPGIASEPMARLRRAKLEVVVPAAQGEPYRALEAAADDADEDEEDASEDEEDEAPKARGKKKGKGAATKVRFVESIPAGRFYLRVGLGRKSSGSYYTPHAFVRFLVQETLGPQVAERSPQSDPQPAAILGLRVLDPAMGSGHFLVEACRYLGTALYEACRLCDERALEAEAEAERATTDAARDEALAKARALRARVEALPDPEDEMLAFLPSRAAEGGETGLSQRKAEAIARRLVAVHCLYGVDKNPLAVELAKLSLWLESYAEGLPLTFLDHRLVRGDSLTGPFFEQVLTLPRSGARLEGLFVQGVADRLGAALGEALAHVRALDATVGKDVADLERKRLAKERLDAALAPFRTLAAAWSGSVMLGDAADDAAYEALLKAVANGADAEAAANANETLRRAVSLGRDGVPYDLAFPEVFHPGGARERKGGFDAVVGNPPWDALQPLAKEFFAAFDLRVLDAPTRREREEVELRLTADPEVSRLYAEYVGEIEATKQLFDRLYSHVGKQAGGKPSGAVTDVWQAFAEREALLLALGAAVGLVLPSAFHANQSATGIRELYLDRLALRCCFSFENRKLLFEIHRSFKFALVVARNEGRPTDAFDCAFYLHDLEWLFEEREPLRYTLDFVKRTGGEYLSLLELRSVEDAEVAQRCFERGRPFGELCEEAGIRLGRELHMTDDAHRFTPVAEILPAADPRDPAVAADLAARGWLTLHEGKTFHQYDDRWGDRPRYLVHVDQLADKPAWREASRHYRLAFRDIARSTDERTGIFAVMPFTSMSETARCEREPQGRASARTLQLAALANAFCFDWLLRFQVAAHVQQFILFRTVVAAAPAAFLTHAALRLTCNHAGYAALWREQVGSEWREPTAPESWPVLASPEARGAVRAAIDAVVAHAYGLARKHFEHVLASFSHKSDPEAPRRCLEAFDELLAIGLEDFCKKHDPYFDVPLVETLPQPVIDLPAPAAASQGASQASLFGDAPRSRHRNRK